MILESLGLQMTNLAFIAITEQRWTGSLGFLKLNIDLKFLLWNRLVNGTKDSETESEVAALDESCDWSCVLWSMLVGGSINNDSCRKYLNHPLADHFNQKVINFAKFVLDNGASPPNGECTCNQSLDKFCIQFAKRDRSAFENELKSYLQFYVRNIKKDPGFPFAVACLPVLAFIRFAREHWINDLQIDHFLAPMELLNHEPNFDLTLPAPFDALVEQFQ